MVVEKVSTACWEMHRTNSATSEQPHEICLVLKAMLQSFEQTTIRLHLLTFYKSLHLSKNFIQRNNLKNIVQYSTIPVSYTLSSFVEFTF